eukprot:Gb_07168 [translate_table: standard]
MHMYSCKASCDFAVKKMIQILSKSGTLNLVYRYRILNSCLDACMRNAQCLVTCKFSANVQRLCIFIWVAWVLWPCTRFIGNGPKLCFSLTWKHHFKAIKILTS